MSLNLAAVSQMVDGEKALGDVGTIHSARATSEVVLTVRGAAKAKAIQLMALKPEVLGSGRVKPAWQPLGPLLAVASDRVRADPPALAAHVTESCCARPSLSLRG